MVQIVDSKGGVVTANHSYTWCGANVCLAHDNTQSGSPVSAQYFGQGVIVGGTPYYYVRDRLGSVTTLVTNSGTVTSQYAFDPYGNESILSGTLIADIGYAGYFHHAASGLNFALHRAYDSTHTRWLNRDPIGEVGGVNLYAYVAEDPVSNVDPLGLCDSNSNSNGISNAITPIQAAHAIEAVSVIAIGIGLAPVEVPLLAAAALITGSYVAGEVIGDYLFGD